MTVLPSANKKTIVFNLRRKECDKEFGADYEKAHGFARFLGFIYHFIPKIGPFRSLSFSVPTTEGERLEAACRCVRRRCRESNTGRTPSESPPSALCRRAVSASAAL